MAGNKQSKLEKSRDGTGAERKPRDLRKFNTLRDDEDAGMAAGRGATASHLPDILAEGGELDRRLEAAENEAGETDDSLYAARSLREAMVRLRKSCESKVGAGALEPARRDRVCVDVLEAGGSQDHDVDQLLRLVVVMKLTEEPGDSLWRSGLEAYRRKHLIYDRILGDFLPIGLHWAGAFRDYRENANPTALKDWEVFAYHVHEQKSSPRPGLVTGLPALDESTGGLNDVTLLGGEPASGKTTMALQLAAGAVKASPAVAVLYVELEMGKHPLYLRLLSQESGVALRRIVSADRTAAENAAIQDAAARLKANVLPRFRVVDLTSHDRGTPLTQQWFRKQIELLLALDGVEKCLVVVDSINRMGVEDAVLTHEEDGPVRFQRLNELDALKARMDVLLRVQRMTRTAAPPAGFPILAVARCRKPDDRGPLDLADLYGGADLGYDAQSVYLLERHNTSDKLVTPVTLRLAKVREWGYEGDVELDFHHTVSIFHPRTPPAQQADGKRPASKSRFKGRT